MVIHLSLKFKLNCFTMAIQGFTNVNAKNICEIKVPRIDINTQNRFLPVLSITKPSPGAQIDDIM